ncbi:hypothetical protein EDD29_3675 [Actinocorallia herbida]|uniref:Ig-like domain-containing protein n=2 Tax=Actinocorallia herbida TaxID=58109 RepID=A0A3N1CXU6_9ACTN|nr:hypothetical protein EDD29_3675 [Actinocorallia herbida]
MRAFTAFVIALAAAVVLLLPVPASAAITGMRASLTAVPAGCSGPPTLTGLVELQRDGVWGTIGAAPQVMVNVFGRPTDLPDAPWIAYDAVPATADVGTFSWPAPIQRATEFYVIAYYGGANPHAVSETVVLQPGFVPPTSGTASDLRVSVSADSATSTTPPTLTGLVEVKTCGTWQPDPSGSVTVYARPADSEDEWSGYGYLYTGPDGTYTWDGTGFGTDTLEFHLVARHPGGLAAWSDLVTLDLGV